MLENMTEMQSQAARLQSIRDGSGTRQSIQPTQVVILKILKLLNSILWF